MQIIPDKTRVLVDTSAGVYKGIVQGSGYQSQIWTYFVLLDDPTGYPNIPIDAKSIAVAYTKVRADVMAIAGVVPKPPEIIPTVRFVL
jgi:hypothetical protein